MSDTTFIQHEAMGLRLPASEAARLVAEGLATYADDHPKSNETTEPEWEAVTARGNVARFPVPGGWLYNTGGGTADTYVPDPNAPHVVAEARELEAAECRDIDATAGVWRTYAEWRQHFADDERPADSIEIDDLAGLAGVGLVWWAWVLHLRGQWGVYGPAPDPCGLTDDDGDLLIAIPAGAWPPAPPVGLGVSDG